MMQSVGNPQMMSMGMLPPGFGLPGAQTQNPNSMGHQGQGQGQHTGQQTTNGMGGLSGLSLQGGSLGQMSGQNFSSSDLMRQQAMQ